MVSGLLTAETFNRFEAQLGRAGIMMAPVTAGLLIALGIILGIKEDSFNSFAVSIAATVIFFIAHWCGRALSVNCDLAIVNSSGRISGYGLFRSIALVALVGLIGLVVFGIYMAIKLSVIEPLYAPLGYAAAVCFLVWFLLNPTLVSIKSDDSSSPGDDVLSLFLFGTLSSLKLHRVIFGGGLILGNLAIAYSMIKIMREEVYILDGITGFSGVIIVFAAALAPLFLYLFFIMSYLIIDLMRAVLRIGK